MLAFNFHSLLDGFAVRDLGSRENDGNTEAGFQLGNSNVEVDITLTGNEKLLRFGIVFIFESKIFFEESGDTLSDLIFITFCLGSDRHLIEGFGICDLLIGKRIFHLRKRIVSIGVVELCGHTDIAHGEHLDFGLLFAANGIDTGKLFVLTRSYVLQNGIAVKLTADNLKEGHLSDERVGNGLKYEEGRGTVLTNGTFDFFVAVDNDLSLVVYGAGQGINDNVKKQTYAAEVRRGAADNGSDIAAENTVVECRNDLFLGNAFAFKEFIHQLFARGSNCFVEHAETSFNSFFVTRGNFDRLTVSAVSKCNGSHINEVEKADDVVAFKKRNNDGTNGAAEFFVHFQKYFSETGFGIVAFVDKERARHLILANEVPSDLRTDFNACFTVNDDQRAACNAKSLKRFTLEVKVSGSIDNIDLCAIVHNGSDRGGKRKASLDLFCVIVANGVTFRGLTESVGFFFDIKHSFCKRSFTACAVSKQAYVANISGVNLFHYINPFLSVNLSSRLNFPSPPTMCIEARSVGITRKIEGSFQISENPTAIIISQDFSICKTFFCFYCLINIEFAPLISYKLNNKNPCFQIFLKRKKVYKKRY